VLAIDGKPIESHQIGAGLAVFSFDNHHFQTVIISLKVSTGAGQSPARKRLGMHPGRRCGSILRWRNGPRMAMIVNDHDLGVSQNRASPKSYQIIHIFLWDFG
jgi:hypothetical protein